MLNDFFKNILKIGNWSKKNDGFPIDYYEIYSASLVYYYNSSTISNANLENYNHKWMHKIKNYKKDFNFNIFNENEINMFNSFFNNIEKIIEKDSVIIFPPLKCKTVKNEYFFDSISKLLILEFFEKNMN